VMPSFLAVSRFAPLTISEYRLLDFG
jgi:hypothetical protein